MVYLTQTKTKLAKRTLLVLLCVIISLFSLLWDSASAFAVTFSQAQEAGKRLSAGYAHSLAIKIDDTVVAWGDNTHGQLDIPEGLSDVKVISAGYYHNLALKADGTVVAWGKTGEGQCAVPEGLSGVSAIAAGAYHSLALKDGGVIAWGLNGNGQCTVPEEAQSGVVAIAAGGYHSLALKEGKVIAWGNNDSGQCTVPADLTDVIAISAGNAHSLALKSDGTVVAWGSNNIYQCEVPEGLSSIVAISAGNDFSVAMTEKGEIRTWENIEESPYGGCGVIAAGGSHVITIEAGRGENAIKMWGNNDKGQCTAPSGFNIVGSVANFTVSTGEISPVFTPNNIHYGVYVDNNVTSVELMMTAVNANQQLSWSKRTVGNLQVGINYVYNTVYLAGTNIYREYSTLIYRAAANVDLKTLKTNIGYCPSLFKPSNTTYTVYVDKDVENISISAIPNDPDATVTAAIGENTYPLNNVPLFYGNNPVDIIVEKDEESKIYTLNIKKGGFLDNLSVSEGYFSPVFNPETFHYSVDVNSNITTLKITPTLKESAHELLIDDIVHGNGIPKEINLPEVNHHMIKLGVKEPSTGVIRTYSLSINRVTKDDFVGSGTLEDPYLIYNLLALQEIAYDTSLLDKHFQLACDIDATNTVNWNNGAGFFPIGNSTNKFTGYFEGAGHTITGLYINRPESEHIGLFGYTEGGEIRNLGLENCTITGKNKVGALFGESNNTYIENCFSTGTVTGTSRVGGLGGSSSGDYLTGYHLDNCYSRASVSGTTATGGLIGELGSGWLNYCYAVGSVQGTGGLVGSLGAPENCYETNCYWDINTTKQATSALGTGQTTTAMKGEATYTNWDFTSTWDIDSETNGGYPYQRIFKYALHSPVVDDSLVLWLNGRYGANNPTTTIWKDLSGKGNHGELKNFNFNESSGWTEEGLRIDGVNDYVCVKNDDSLNSAIGTETFTLSAWINAKKKMDYQGIINKIRNAYFSQCPGSFVVDGTGVSFRFIIGEGVDGGTAVGLASALTFDKWVHLVGTADGEYMRLYRNGELLGTTTITLDPPTNDDDLIIGAQYANVRSFFGSIGDVQIYNRALTGAEVVQNYQAGLQQMKAVTAANLAELTVTRGAFSPTFKASTLNYTVLLEDSTVDSVNISATPLSTDATVTIDGQGGIGSQTQTITITSGMTTISIVVTEADGTTTKTYKVKIIKPGYLTNLSIDGVTVPGFASETLDYTVNVANSVAAVAIAATLEDPSTQGLMLNNQPYTSGTLMNIPLNVGTNTIPIKVTVPGYSTTYTLNIYRATTADLQALTIEQGTLEPVFDPATSTYTVTLNQAIDSINITATPFEETATVTIGETEGTGTQNATVTLALGTNPINIVVTSADDSLTKTYTINVIRPAYLTALSVNNAGQPLTLTPEFASTTFAYTLPTVANNVTSLDITATGENTANVLINDITPKDNTVNVPLNVGANTITIKAAPEAEPELISTYTLTVNREPSANADLESLTTTAGTWDSDFDSATTTYKVTLEGCINTLNLTAQAVHPQATVKINGTATQTAAIPLNLGTNPVTITVNAEDGTTTKNYTVNIIRPAYLTALSVKAGG